MTAAIMSSLGAEPARQRGRSAGVLPNFLRRRCSFQHVLTPKPVARAISAGHAGCAAMRRIGAPRSHLHPRGRIAGLARDGSRGSSPSGSRTRNLGGAN
jgi:hypothetical protein